MKKIGSLGMCFFAFLTPFTASSLLNELTPVLPFGTAVSSLVFVLYIFSIAYYGKIYLTKESKTVLLTTLIPLVLSTSVVLFNLFILDDLEYFVYIDDKFWTRLVNYVLYISIFIFGNSVMSRNDASQNLKIANAYLMGICVLAGIGIWQFLNFYFGVPIFDLQARTHIHGVDSISGLFFNKRLTSLTSEPSYLASFLIDGLIVAWALIPKSRLAKTSMVAISFVLIFSFSSGGYVNAIILAMIIFFVPGMFKFRHKSKVGLSAAVMASVSLFAWKDKIVVFFYPFIGRLGNLRTLEYGRVYSSIMPLVWITEKSALNLFFGFGPGSYKYASLIKQGSRGQYVNETSNNVFGDITFEMGIIGLIAISFMFIYLFRTAYSQIGYSRYRKVAFLLINHLAISSMYRADFVSPRFWLVLILIVLFLNLEESEEFCKHVIQVDEGSILK